MKFLQHYSKAHLLYSKETYIAMYNCFDSFLKDFKIYFDTHPYPDLCYLQGPVLSIWLIMLLQLLVVRGRCKRPHQCLWYLTVNNKTTTQWCVLMKIVQLFVYLMIRPKTLYVLLLFNILVPTLACRWSASLVLSVCKQKIMFFFQILPNFLTRWWNLLIKLGINVHAPLTNALK